MLSKNLAPNLERYAKIQDLQTSTILHSPLSILLQKVNMSIHLYAL